MRYSPLVVPVASILALMACNQSPAANKSAAAERNAAPTAAVATQGDTGNAATGNGLWGVAEGEDEASHRGLDFIVFNRTGRTVTAVSIRPDEGPLDPGVPENPWSANALTERELPDGQRAAVHYESSIEMCRWEVRATFADGQTRAIPTVNLCETIRVDLR